MKVLICGVAGFIGRHLAWRLKRDGHSVVGVDVVQDPIPNLDGHRWMDCAEADEERELFCFLSRERVDWVFQLAASMGGRGFIDAATDETMIHNATANLNVLRASRDVGCVSRYLFASSACVYPPSATGLLDESRAHPADPDGWYGWEKLNAERWVQAAARADFGTRIARLDNTYGPGNPWVGGREKVPAAIARKVAEAKRDGRRTIPVWGDGTTRRVFSYVDDTVEGLVRLMASDYPEPLNLGGGDYAPISTLIEETCRVAGYAVTPEYEPTRGGGSADRRTDHSRCRDVLGWEPRVTLAEGMAETYPWVEREVLGR